MLRNLTKIANKLDTLGLTKEADLLDSIIQKMAQTTGATGAEYEFGKKVDTKNKYTFSGEFRKSRPTSIKTLNNYLYQVVMNNKDKFDSATMDAAEEISSNTKWTTDTDKVWSEFTKKAGKPEAGINWQKWANENGYEPTIFGIYAFYTDNIKTVLNIVESGSPTASTAPLVSTTEPTAKESTESPSGSGSTGAPVKDIEEKKKFVTKVLNNKGIPDTKTSLGLPMSDVIANFEGKKYLSVSLPILILDDEESVAPIVNAINSIDNKRNLVRPSGPPSISKPGRPGLPGF